MIRLQSDVKTVESIRALDKHGYYQLRPWGPSEGYRRRWANRRGNGCQADQAYRLSSNRNHYNRGKYRGNDRDEQKKDQCEVGSSTSSKPELRLGLFRSFGCS